MTTQRFDRSQTSGQGRPPSQQSGLPAGYLQNGYFDQEGNINPDLITTIAEQVARVLLEKGAMSSTQLRRFYNKARSIKDRLDTGASFPQVVSKIRELERDAVYSVGREVAPEVFRQFMERNVRLAEKGQKEFEEGFLQHFQSVVAYGKYIETKGKK